MASSQRTGSWRWDPVKTAHPNSLYISQSRCSRPDLTSVFWGPQSPKRSLTASRPAGRKRRLGDPDQGHLGQARTRRRAGARTESEGTGSDAGLMLGALGPPKLAQTCTCARSEEHACQCSPRSRQPAEPSELCLKKIFPLCQKFKDSADAGPHVYPAFGV